MKTFILNQRIREFTVHGIIEFTYVSHFFGMGSPLFTLAEL